MDDSRLRSLRAEMAKKKIDIYMLMMSDFHASEYVGDYFKEIEFLSGFTGTNATIVVTKDEAGLWTDGRHFIQARREMAGSGVVLFEMGTEGVPTVKEFVTSHLKKGQVLAYDGRLMPVATHREYLEVAKEAEASVVVKYNLIDKLWKERPALPCKPMWVVKKPYAGVSAKSKIKQVFEVMKEKKADAFLLTSLYDIAWLLNLRGDDISSVPVFMSYFYLTFHDATLYVDKKSLNAEVKKHLEKNQITVKGYEDIYKDLKHVKEKNVLLDPAIVNAALISAFPKKVSFVEDANPTELMKAIKNEVEQENTRLAHIKDGVAVTKFIYWLKQNIGKMEITEVSAAEKLLEFREAQEHFIDVSFDTIAAYGPNAAMMHYEATPESYSVLEPKGFLLVDSGGHYLEGTTDITRTIVLGPLTEHEREAYTLTVRSHLRLLDAHFPDGATGQNLDILARGPMWDLGLDYRCGTGHGVGHILNVHEGPNSFRWRMTDRMRVWPLKPGMITTDEPGLYVEDELGVRIESELLCVEDRKTEYGQFYKFENLTFCPIDLDAIDVDKLTYLERKSLNDYHKAVYEKLAPLLTKEEAEWLKHETREV